MTTLKTYHFALVRYVRDPKRMEPINAGVVLQDEQRLDYRLNPHLSKRSDVTTSVWQSWREFFETEIRRDDAPLFHPERTSISYFDYLSSLCTDTVLLSRPLVLQTSNSRPFDDVLARLYTDLVAPVIDAPVVRERPTSIFRSLAEDRDLDSRGLRKHAYVQHHNARLWMAYRQFVNGTHVVIDKVEVNVNIGYTANEIERLPVIANHLANIATSDRRQFDYSILVDDLATPFTDQSSADFEAMRAELGAGLKLLGALGVKVVGSPAAAEELVTRLDRIMPERNSR